MVSWYLFVYGKNACTLQPLEARKRTYVHGLGPFLTLQAPTMTVYVKLKNL